jgi:PAS domain S-box-containing protein
MAAQERALSRGALRIFAQPDEAALLRVALDVVSSLLQVDVVALFLTSDGAGTPRCRAIKLQGGAHLSPRDEAPADAFATDVLRRQAPRRCRSWSPPGGEPCGSALAVPLGSQDVALGVLIVGRREACRFRDDHVSLLSAAGQQLALALLRFRAPAPREHEDGARELLDSIAEGLLVVDDELRTTYLNPAASEIIGLPAPQALGRRVGEVLELTDDAGQALAIEAYPFARALWEDRPVALTANVVRRDRRTPFAFSVAPIRDQTGRAAYAVGVFHDCSREKEMERLRTEFISMASHEIRTPLSALQGFTELMLSREVPPNVQRDWLSLMNHEAVRLAALIEEMLDVTRIESGRVRLKLAPVQVGDVVCRVVRLLDGDGRRVHLVIERAPTVLADGDKLAQVVTNLLRNALDYSLPERPVEVEVARRCLAQHRCSLVAVDGEARTVAAHDCRPTVSVAVRDQGIGMTPEELSRAFQPFYRAEASRELLPEGSGLGLAIARAIVERHQGCLWAHSRPERGSSFGFCLPAQEAPPSDGAT